MNKNQSRFIMWLNFIILFSSLLILLSLITTQVVYSATANRKPKELSNGQNCTNHLQIIDRCGSQATYSYTTPFNQYPQTANEMKVSCDRINEGLKCLRIYNKCLSSLSKRSLLSYINSRSRHSKRLCSNLNDQRAIDFWTGSACMASKNKILVANERELISGIQFLASNVTMKWEDRLHNACCIASSYKTKLSKDSEPECAKYKDTMDDFINSMIGELLDTVCPEQTRLNDICAKLSKLTLPKEWRVSSLTGAALDLIVKLSDNPKDST